MFHSVLVVFGMVAVAFAAVVPVYLWARKAPEGYEDQDGFHLIQKRARGAEILAAKSRFAEPVDTAPLEKPELLGAPR
jgi:hypothetical protein